MLVLPDSTSVILDNQQIFGGFYFCIKDDLGEYREG